MPEALPILLLKRLATSSPVSLIDVDDIECGYVLLAAQLIHAESPFGMPLWHYTLVPPITVWDLTPAGVSLASSLYIDTERT